ncbi:8024_t:CDS:1, partial [Gigaspora margarita]
GLWFSKEKCHFFKKQLSFLGHLVNEKGITPDSSKIEKVKNFLKPSTLTEL